MEPAGSYAEATRRSVSAEVSSNRGAPRGHLYILLFDQQHFTAGNEQTARCAAEAFIKSRVRQSDRIAIVGIPGPGPQIGFTADRTRATAELLKVRGSLERTVTTPAGKLSVHEAYEAADGNDAVISGVLTRQAADPSADVGAAAPTDGGLIDRGSRRSQEDPSVMRRLIQENARTIVAHADAPSAGALPARGQYRRISVRVKRPSAHVSARTGYAAPKAGASVDRRQAIDAALALPFAQQGLRVDYTTYTLRSDNAGRAHVLLSLEADLPVEAASPATADVVFIVRDSAMDVSSPTVPIRCRCPTTPQVAARQVSAPTVCTSKCRPVRI